MKTLEYSGHGQTPIVAERPVPKARMGEVLVKIAGAALNPLDTKIHAGYMTDFFPVTFPHVPGTDISGTIEAIGDGASGWKQGDEIIARLDPFEGGAFAQYAIVPAGQLVRAPTSMPLAESAGLVTVGGTAWQILFEEHAISGCSCTALPGRSVPSSSSSPRRRGRRSSPLRPRKMPTTSALSAPRR